MKRLLFFLVLSIILMPACIENPIKKGIEGMDLALVAYQPNQCAGNPWQKGSQSEWPEPKSQEEAKAIAE